MFYVIVTIALMIVFFLSGAFFSSWFYRDRIRWLTEENEQLRKIIANPDLRTVRYKWDQPSHPGERPHRRRFRDLPTPHGYQPDPVDLEAIKPPPGPE